MMLAAAYFDSAAAAPQRFCASMFALHCGTYIPVPRHDGTRRLTKIHRGQPVTSTSARPTIAFAHACGPLPFRPNTNKHTGMRHRMHLHAHTHRRHCHHNHHAPPADMCCASLGSSDLTRVALGMTFDNEGVVRAHRHDVMVHVRV